MRFMMIVKATKASEAGAMPTQEQIEAMMKYNEELVKAGVLVDGAGLHPSSAGMRITFPAGQPKVVTEGPFAATKELISGYWILNVKSREEAVEWAMRAPDPNFGGGEGQIELRPMFGPEDFDEETERREKALIEEIKEQQKRS